MNKQLSDQNIGEFETVHAIHWRKNQKLLRAGGITAQLGKYGYDKLRQAVDQIILEAFSLRNINSGISRIISKIFSGRIVPYAQNIIGPYQRDFTPGKSATDQIYSTRQAMENYRSVDINCTIYSLTSRLPIIA